MLWNPPYRPQKNGVVERSQGVGKAWAEPQRCHSVAQLQQRVDHEDHLQREKYPSIAGQARLTAYPQLQHSGRVYNVAQEAALWDLARVGEHLSEYVWQRKIDGQGKLSLYDRSRHVGKWYARQQVVVHFDPQLWKWVVCDASGAQLRELPAEEISVENVVGLQISPPPTKSATAKKQ